MQKVSQKLSAYLSLKEKDNLGNTAFYFWTTLPRYQDQQTWVLPLNTFFFFWQFGRCIVKLLRKEGKQGRYPPCTADKLSGTCLVIGSKATWYIGFRWEVAQQQIKRSLSAVDCTPVWPPPHHRSSPRQTCQVIADSLWALLRAFHLHKRSAKQHRQ